MNITEEFLAFKGHKLIASGSAQSVEEKIENELKQGDKASILFFLASSGHQIDLDSFASDSIQSGATATGSDAEEAVVDTGNNQPQIPEKRGRGRPKLGVIGREVTLLPRHWEWLDKQRGGASATIRRLVEQDRKAGADQEQIRQSQDSAYRFMYAIAGNLPEFEEVVRALYARDKGAFERDTAAWPKDIRDCSLQFADQALS